MLEENPKLKKLLVDPKFHRILHAVNIDEVHCISQWGPTFRPSYLRLGVLRALLPSGTPFFITSATLPTKMLDDVRALLGFKETTPVIKISNNRPNIYLEVREMMHSKVSLKDLDFVAPLWVRSTPNLTRTIVYVDT